MRVLIAEDDDSTRELFEAYFESEHEQVECVSNGADALTTMRRCPPDVVVLDLAMPILNGWEVLAERTADPDLSRIPIIVVSALSDVAVRSRQLGAVACLQKPVDLHALIRLARRHATTCPDADHAVVDRASAVTQRLQDRVLKALLQSEQQYRTLMNHASDAMLVVDAQGRCVLSNRRAAHWLGYHSEELCRLAYADMLARVPGAGICLGRAREAAIRWCTSRSSNEKTARS
jgi:CheY-like chemotaxis protein